MIRKTALLYFALPFLTTVLLPSEACCQIGADPSGICSDDFSSLELDPRIWKFIDPVGDAAYELTGSHLRIFLPQGSDHDIWRAGNRSARLMQPANDADFQVEAHFDVQLGVQYAAQGILVECDDDNFIRFEFNSTLTDVRIYSATFVNGEPRTRALLAIDPNNLIYMRVARSGDEWIQSYSYDKREWHIGAVFVHPIEVTAIGLYAANGGAFPTLTASVDYFFNLAMPIHPEDNVTATPQKPAYLAADAVSMSEIRLCWSDDNDEEDNYLIERSSDGISFVRIASVGANSTEYIDKIEISGGEHTYRVAASNVLGESEYSDPVKQTIAGTPVITFFYGDAQKFGHLGMSQRHINILGNISDADTVSHLTYSLNSAVEESLRIGPDRMRLSCAGDFNIELEPQQLRLGQNELTVRAMTKDKAAVSKTMDVMWHPTQAGFSGRSIRWEAVTCIQDVAQVIDGRWKISNGMLRTAAVGFDRLVAIGDTAWSDYEITVPITLYNFFPGSAEGGGPGVGILARWTGHTGDDAPRLGHPYGILAWYRARSNGNDPRLCLYQNGDHLAAEDLSGRKLNLHRPYLFKLCVQTIENDKTRYSFKVWPQQEAEPKEWDLTTTVSGPMRGALVLLSHKADAGFGDVSITSIGHASVHRAADGLDAVCLSPCFYPNPFNSVTGIKISLRESQPVRLQIYNLLGELLVVPLDADMAAGDHYISWNGRDNSDRISPSGVYLYNLQAGHEKHRGRLMLVR
ncbi:T9SS type A sorting domain-containing protein [candidate division KSB1 bacterium]|nr:T9SS type A sorting domain-containing protein [candidate division KSB1 bacterium]